MFRVKRDPMDHPLDVDKPLIEILVAGLGMACCWLYIYNYTKFQFLNSSFKDSPFKAVVYSTTLSVGIGCRGLDFHIEIHSSGELSGSVHLLCIAHGTGNIVLRLFVGGETAWHLSQLSTVISAAQQNCCFHNTKVAFSACAGNHDYTLTKQYSLLA